MPKRLTETTKWEDPWFMGLSSKAKILFLFLIDRCDIAGFYERNDRLMAIYLGFKESEFDALFREISKSVEIRDNWVFVKNFIRHQKNFPLNADNNCHKAIVKSLSAKSGLFSDIYEEMQLGKFRGCQAPSKPLPRGLGKGKGKGKERVNRDSKDLSIDQVKHKNINNKYISCLEVMNIWNSVTSGFLPSAQYLNDTREKTLKARIKTFQKAEDWREIFLKVKASDFLCGRSNSNRPFKATFDWVIRPTNLTKILEGNYDNQKHEKENPYAKYSQATH